MSIVELRQTAKNEWKAKYQGNYGLYTIKIATDGEKTARFSCSCPSDYSPCKHIPIIEKAIAKKLASGTKQGKDGGLKIEDVLGSISAESLRKFIVRQAEYNDELHNAVFLEFVAGVKNAKVNKYVGVIQKALASAPTSEDDSYYYEEVLSIDALDQWLDKARGYVKQEQYDEAILICKTCIEEYSHWMCNVGAETSAMFSRAYQSIPFDILEEAAKHSNKRELFDYCLAEIKKQKYAGTGFEEGFHGLLATLAAKVDPGAFIALQDQLLAGISDKNSDAAELVLRRKIDFYKRLGQSKKAHALLEENVQIVSFRLELAEAKIAKRDFAAAKMLLNDFLTGEGRQSPYLHGICRKLLLDIAQKENDVPRIKELAYGFIKSAFQQKYYEIYKATCAAEEWIAEREKLFLRYSEPKHFNDSAANLLAAEGEAERLMQYIEEHLSSENLVRYYKSFAAACPEKTVELFEKVIVAYAENNIGRSHYEHVFSLLQKMSKVKGGKKEAADLVAVFRLRYKNRKAMMETLRRL